MGRFSDSLRSTDPGRPGQALGKAHTGRDRGALCSEAHWLVASQLPEPVGGPAGEGPAARHVREVSERGLGEPAGKDSTARAQGRRTDLTLAH